MLLDEDVNDYDYYFTNKETVLAVAEYFVSEFNKKHDRKVSVQDDDGRVKVFIQSEGVAGEPEGHEIDEEDVFDVKDDKEDFEPVFLSTNAISLRGKVQIVLRFYGDADEIHENYDFVHAKCYWRAENNHLSLPRESLESILTKELIYTGSKYPLCSIFRAKKFINRGWYINAGQYLKMALQLNEMDLLDVKILEEQLTGVDDAYFQMLLNAIEEKKEKDPNFKLNNSYLIEVINRIFN